MLEQSLKKFFGYDSFRLNQKAIIESVLNNEDVLALMPTGGGKSICFQLPGLIKQETTLVISPLISLMKDQVDALVQNGVNAAFINSTQSTEEYQKVIDDLANGSLDFLYVAPESLFSNPLDTIIKRLSPGPII